MSGAFDETDMMAAEYVLGLLDPARARDVENRARRDPALARAIEAWARMLQPLAGDSGAVAPDADVWRRIEGSLRTRPGAARAGGGADRGADWSADWAGQRRDWSRRRRGVLIAGVIAAAAAVVLGVYISRPTRPTQVASPMLPPAPPTAPAPVARPPPAPPTTGEVPSPPAATPSPMEPPPVLVIPLPTEPLVSPSRPVAVGLLVPWIGGEALHASVDASGLMEVKIPRPIAVGTERRLDVWAKPRDAVAPRLLGEISGSGGSVSFHGLAPVGATVMVTNDRRGPAGERAPGPTLYQGILKPGGS